MRAQLLAVAGLAAAVLAVATPAQAQTGSNTIVVKRGELALSPYAGYLITSKFANGPLGTSLGQANGAIYGVQGSLPLSPNASLVGGIAYSSADLRVGVPILSGINVGTSKSWIYEGDLELHAAPQKAGLASGFAPFLQIGAGAIHRNVTMGVEATSTDFAVNGGVGADYAITPALGFRLMVKDYIGKAKFDNTDLLTTNTMNNVALDAGVRFTF